MKLSELKISNFRCFGPETTTIPLDDLSIFIGANGSGKTAALEALNKMFGVSSFQRELSVDDFHVPADETEEVDVRKLFIEAKIIFPELAEDNRVGNIPQTFNHMIIENEGDDPYCRIRLEATWTKTDIPGGEVTPELWWINSAEQNPPDNVKHKMDGRDRSLIKLFYIPASRDASKQLANTSGTLLHQLLSAVKWENHRQDIKNQSDEFKKLFTQIDAVKIINSHSKASWTKLYSEGVYQTPSMRFTAGDFQDILREAHIVFNPTASTTRDHKIDKLSDGQKSLFYLSFINTIFRVRANALEGESAAEFPDIANHIEIEKLNSGSLNILAVEEPENHLSPHYLSRIMDQLKTLTQIGDLQAFITSHSSSIVGRVDPVNLRYFRCDPQTGTASTLPITLPTETAEALQYVKEAVRAYPELYFARSIILCEGDSEEVVLPKLARSIGEELDTAFISVVPLGGRFIKHFWRLLNDLKIPHTTLLDLDQERSHGGWKTIAYISEALTQYLPEERANELKDALQVKREEDIRTTIEARDPRNLTHIKSCVLALRDFGVFFSEPLDFDFLMLEAYTDSYKSIPSRGPQGLKDEELPQAKIDSSIPIVLKEGGGDGSTYSSQQKALFPWYSLLFLSRGKPATHTYALMGIVEDVLKEQIPEPIKELFNYIKKQTQAAEAEEAIVSPEAKEDDAAQAGELES